jgi:hypothetical protein
LIEAVGKNWDSPINTLASPEVEFDTEEAWSC